MERPYSAIPVSDRPGCRRVHSGFAGAGVPCRRGKTDVSAGAAGGAGVPDRRAASVATPPGTSGTVLRDVPDTAPRIGDGDVRVCLLVVPGGCTADGNLAGLPEGHRFVGAIVKRVEKDFLSTADARLHEYQFGCAARGRPRGMGHHADWHTVGVFVARVRGFHLRLGESESVVVHATYAGSFSVLGDGVRHCAGAAGVHAHVPFA